LWAHEAYRLFYDRLVETEEKVWCENLIQSIGQEHFRGISLEALQLPILFSNYHNKLYVSVKKEEIRDIITARLKTFYEESLNVPIVVFDAVIDHILRIDRVLR
jgi:dynein heavy chain 1